MFAQRRSRNLVEAAFTTLALIYHITANNLRKGQRNIEVIVRRSGDRWIALSVERSGGGGNHGGDNDDRGGDDDRGGNDNSGSGSGSGHGGGGRDHPEDD